MGVLGYLSKKISHKPLCLFLLPSPPLLSRFLGDLQSLLSDQLIGLYLYGSLASGDFNLQSSDIDFVAVTKDALTSEQVVALEAMHQRLWASEDKWAKKLEGSYITQAALRRYNPTNGPFPCVNEGQFYLAHHESDWIIQRDILRRAGVVLFGPPPETLIDPVAPDEVRGAVQGILQSWWAQYLDNPVRLQSDDYQAYAILTMCRSLYTLTHGQIASKPASARWAKERLDPRWHASIDWALAWPSDQPRPELSLTLDLIRHALASE